MLSQHQGSLIVLLGTAGKLSHPKTVAASLHAGTAHSLMRETLPIQSQLLWSDRHGSEGDLRTKEGD